MDGSWKRYTEDTWRYKREEETQKKLKQERTLIEDKEKIEESKR